MDFLTYFLPNRISNLPQVLTLAIFLADRHRMMLITYGLDSLNPLNMSIVCNCTLWPYYCLKRARLFNVPVFDVMMPCAVFCADWSDRIAGKEVLWADRDPDRIANDDAIKFSGIPYMILGSRVLECCCGILRHPKKNVNENYNVSASQ